MTWDLAEEDVEHQAGRGRTAWGAHTDTYSCVHSLDDCHEYRHTPARRPNRRPNHPTGYPGQAEMKAGADETDLHTRESLSASLLTLSGRENPSTNPSIPSDPANPSPLPTSNPLPHPSAHTSHPPSSSLHASYDPHSPHPTFQHHTDQVSSAHEQPHYSAPPSHAAAPPSTAYTGDQSLPRHPSHNRATT